MSVDQYKKEIGMMNLEKLIQDREGISSKKFPIPDKELLFRYEQLYTGAVNDVMREFCLLEQALPVGLNLYANIILLPVLRLLSKVHRT